MNVIFLQFIFVRTRVLPQLVFVVAKITT